MSLDDPPPRHREESPPMLPPPTPSETRPKITSQSANVAEELQRTLRWLFIATLILYFVMGGVVWWTWYQSDRSFDEIQTQRQIAILQECVATNGRHDEAVQALVVGSDLDLKNAPNRDVQKEIRRRRDVTVSLLDALAPHQDCRKLVDDSVQKDR